jgi:hypothetical protein
VTSSESRRKVFTRSIPSYSTPQSRPRSTIKLFGTLPLHNL